MFCPKCKSEFREGFTYCKECETDLVSELSKNESENKIRNTHFNIDATIDADFVELISTRNWANISFIKSILDSENIPYYTFGETRSRANIDGIKIFIPKASFEVAQDLLKDIIK